MFLPACELGPKTSKDFLPRLALGAQVYNPGYEALMVWRNLQLIARIDEDRLEELEIVNVNREIRKQAHGASTYLTERLAERGRYYPVRGTARVIDHRSDVCHKRICGQRQAGRGNCLGLFVEQPIQRVTIVDVECSASDNCVSCREMRRGEPASRGGSSESLRSRIEKPFDRIDR
ncbi:hypothetical protein QWJ46_05480 [Rhizobium sp. CBN3]|uniref:hypothetical protein n=1 Tax=Rhizobium sp. CBN3 TaxID=3058045 RepID=UPI00267323BE|nr:hypothetical protein [Rhizobium sp. CBN3]MDO3432131.1 hypothetical protein [Rhizobium sp. CBN3]